MKLPLAIFAASLALNVGLFATLSYRPTLAPTSFRDYFSRSDTADSHPQASAEAAEAKPAKQIEAAKRDAWASLQTTDLRDLVARLRAAGFPADIIRAIVAAEIDAQMRPRFKALAERFGGKEFWKTDRTSVLGGANKLSEEISALYRERSKLQKSVLGDEAFADGGDVSASLRRRFGDLPQAKIELVKQIEEDYSEMTQQIRSAMQGITLPEDREKLALLQREKHADLAAILSPQELENYDMRTSNVTNRIRAALTIMDASESEFRTIYKTLEPFKDTLYPTYVGSGPPTDYEKRQEAQAQAAEQLKAALGDARYAEYARGNDRDYQQLYRFAKQENVSLELANQAYALRETVAAESGRIANNASLSFDEKRNALKTLADNTRVQLTNLLGSKAGTAYATNANWLRYIADGRTVTFGPDGTPRSQMLRGTPPPKG